MTVTGSENYTVSYTYDLNNRLLTETRTGSSPFTATLAYDRNGNQLSRSSGGQTEIRVYNAFNQLTEYNNGNTMSAYAYRADGLRHSVSVNGVRTYHVWALGHIMSEHDSDNRVVGRYTRGVGGRLIRCHVRHWWYLFDARGSVVQRVDFSGNVLHSYRYNAFGVEISPDPGNGNRFRFNGEYHDLHRGGEIYLRARIYNPRTGRFLSPDPHWNITNMIFGDSPTMRNDRYMPSVHAILQSGNLYMFTMHNPVFWADSSGLFATPVNVIGAILGAGGGAMLGRMVADYFNITGWRRTATIAGFTIGGAAIGWFAPGVINSLANSLAISLGLMTTGGVLLGTDFGKLGVLIKNKGQQVVN